jgi:hypothetical protein
LSNFILYWVYKFTLLNFSSVPNHDLTSQMSLLMLDNLDYVVLLFSVFINYNINN